MSAHAMVALGIAVMALCGKVARGTVTSLVAVPLLNLNRGRRESLRYETGRVSRGRQCGHVLGSRGRCRGVDRVVSEGVAGWLGGGTGSIRECATRVSVLR